MCLLVCQTLLWLSPHTHTDTLFSTLDLLTSAISNCHLTSLSLLTHLLSPSVFNPSCVRASNLAKWLYYLWTTLTFPHPKTRTHRHTCDPVALHCYSVQSKATSPLHQALAVHAVVSLQWLFFLSWITSFLLIIILKKKALWSLAFHFSWLWTHDWFAFIHTKSFFLYVYFWLQVCLFFESLNSCDSVFLKSFSLNLIYLFTLCNEQILNRFKDISPSNLEHFEDSMIEASRQWWYGGYSVTLQCIVNLLPKCSPCPAKYTENAWPSPEFSCHTALVYIYNKTKFKLN